MNRKIGALDEESCFHDSSLISLTYAPSDACIRVVLSTPGTGSAEELVELEFLGVLRAELETLGDGYAGEGGVPPEIYDVYSDDSDPEFERWANRLRDTGDLHPDQLCCITLASSYLRGWGVRDSLEGIRIVCRDVRIGPAPASFAGSEYPRPRIPGD